jgi:hypothetical protein
MKKWQNPSIFIPKGGIKVRVKLEIFIMYFFKVLLSTYTKHVADYMDIHVHVCLLIISQKPSPKIVNFITPGEGFLCQDVIILLYRKNIIFL